MTRAAFPWQAFQVFDKDNSGYISAAELKQVMKSLDDKLTEEDFREMLQDADRSGDGTIDYVAQHAIPPSA